MARSELLPLLAALVVLLLDLFYQEGEKGLLAWVSLLGLAGLPPSPLFLSEVLIMAGGIQAGQRRQPLAPFPAQGQPAPLDDTSPDQDEQQQGEGDIRTDSARQVQAPHHSERGGRSVGAGPGDPELLTLRALRVLRSADAVLHDDLVAPEILKLIPPSAQRHNVGKRCGKKKITQVEINFLMVILLLVSRAQSQVLLLSSPLHFPKLLSVLFS